MVSVIDGASEITRLAFWAKPKRGKNKKIEIILFILQKWLDGKKAQNHCGDSRNLTPEVRSSKILAGRSSDSSNNCCLPISPKARQWRVLQLIQNDLQLRAQYRFFTGFPLSENSQPTGGKCSS
jgi:hypothetical protein